MLLLLYGSSTPAPEPIRYATTGGSGSTWFGNGGRMGLYAPTHGSEARARHLPAEEPSPEHDFIHQQNDAIIQIILCMAASGVLQ